MLVAWSFLSAMSMLTVMTIDEGPGRKLPICSTNCESVELLFNFNSIDVWHVNDLNYGLIDCTFHETYCLYAQDLSYSNVLIACQASGMAYFTYEVKGPSCA